MKMNKNLKALAKEFKTSFKEKIKQKVKYPKKQGYMFYIKIKDASKEELFKELSRLLKKHKASPLTHPKSISSSSYDYNKEVFTGLTAIGKVGKKTKKLKILGYNVSFNQLNKDQ